MICSSRLVYSSPPRPRPPPIRRLVLGSYTRRLLSAAAAVYIHLKKKEREDGLLLPFGYWIRFVVVVA